MESPFSDKRFSHVMKDPRFRRVPKKERKVKIDKRFQGMFKDSRFKLKYSVDKKGRPVHKTSDEDLKRFYELSEGENSTDVSSGDESELSDCKSSVKVERKKTTPERPDDSKARMVSQEKTKIGSDTVKNRKSQMRKKKTKSKETNLRKEELSDRSEDEVTGDREEETVLIERNQPNQTDSEGESEESGVGTGPDLARGEGNISSSDEEDGDEDWQPDTGLEMEHNWGEADSSVPEATELGRRLAVCNMDWDKIKARDLFVLFSSFKPTGGIIHSVKIYPSEYGMQQMKEENTKGPLIQSDPRDTKQEDGEGSEYHMERLRKYQLNRLRYYYAVVVCDSIETASHIYEECDGLEYETSSARLDLRFIPEGMMFDQEPHSVCEDLPESSTFQPSTFLTTALCQSKVELTWDETERDRLALTRKKISADEINDADFKAYLASSSEDESDPYKGMVDNSDDELSGAEDTEETSIQKYRSLLKDLEDSEKQKADRDVEMEITWEPGLKEATEEIVKKKESKKELSVWEQYLQRKKEKKAKKREERLKEKMSREFESNQSVEEEEMTEKIDTPVAGGEDAFSDDELPEDIDISDPYFKSELQPNEQSKLNLKKKKGKKQKVKLTESEEEEAKQKRAELSLLMMDEEDQEKRQHFSLRSLMKDEKRKKRKKGNNTEETAEEDRKTEDTFEFNPDDHRFKAMYSSHLFNIDPSAPEFKRTKVMDTIIEEKLKRRKHMKKSEKQDSDIRTDDSSVRDKRVKDPSISALVNSVKTKTKNYYKKKAK